MATSTPTISQTPTSSRFGLRIIAFIIGTIAVASSILVIGMRNPVHSALFLLLTFLCVAVLFVMQAAEFVRGDFHCVAFPVRAAGGVVRRARHDLDTVGAKVFGVVLNNVDLRREGYDNYYYYRYYSAYGQEHTSDSAT